MRIRALDSDDHDDAALGRLLVTEYVEATLVESEQYGEAVPRDMVASLFPETADFGAVYGRPGCAYLVAEPAEGGSVAGGVGLLALERAREARPQVATAEMKRLWVRPEHRGQGTARHLAVALMDFARTLGYARMVLDVTPQRTAATGLYRSLGFRDSEPVHEYPFSMTFLARDL